MLPSPGTNTVHVKTCSEGHLESHEGKHIREDIKLSPLNQLKKKKNQEQSFSNWICTFPPKLRSECEKYSVLLKKELVFSLNKNQSIMHEETNMWRQ